MRTTHEDGAVLITTLLIMSVMATLAVSIMDDVLFATRRAIAVEDSAQATHYLDGAEAFALATIAEQMETLEPAQLNASLRADDLLVFPIEDGTIAVSLRDGSNCLSPDISTDANAQEQLKRFFITSGLGVESQSLMLRIKDWQDADQSSEGGAEDGVYLGATPSYRTADSPINVVSELRAVRGMTPELYAQIAPYMCIKPSVEPKININTLSEAEAVILAATLGKDLGFASGLIARTPSEGWDDGTFAVLPDFEDDDSAQYLDLVGFEPTVLRVNIRVEYRGAVRHSLLMVTPDRNPEVLHRLRGEEAVPPRLRTNEDDET